MLLEKIAESIWNEAGGGMPWNKAPEEERQRIMRYAHAALKAVAVPTPEMLSNGNRALQAWDDSEHYRSPITGIYRAMISAELPPEPAAPRGDQFDEL